MSAPENYVVTHDEDDESAPYTPRRSRNGLGLFWFFIGLVLGHSCLPSCSPPREHTVYRDVYRYRHCPAVQR